MQKILSIIGKLHYRYAYKPRIDSLVSVFSKHLLSGDRVLDVGCGSGILGSTLSKKISGLQVEGIENNPRGNEPIPVHSYDGKVFPFSEDVFDVVIIADVLHHSEDPIKLLQECARVAKRLVIIKDHLYRGWFSYIRISLLDWAANVSHGVSCIYKYWSHIEWQHMFDQAGLEVQSQIISLKLYPGPLNLMFGGKLHLVTFTKPPVTTAL